MVKERLEQLREVINEMIITSDSDKDILVTKSQELDELIVQAIKESNFINNILGEELREDFEKIINSIYSFELMYDSIRVVDPIKKEVLEIKKGELCSLGKFCYSIKDENNVCENCISIRAYNEDDI